MIVQNNVLILRTAWNKLLWRSTPGNQTLLHDFAKLCVSYSFLLPVPDFCSA